MLYLYVQCPRNPEEVSDALKLEIQEVMGHLVGPGNQTLVLWTREGEETWFVTLIRAGRHPQGPPHWRLILRGGLALVPADLKPSPRSSRGAYRPENPPNNKCCAAGPFITRSPGLRASPRLVYSFLSQAALLARVGTALFLKRNRECKHF